VDERQGERNKQTNLVGLLLILLLNLGLGLLLDGRRSSGGGSVLPLELLVELLLLSLGKLSDGSLSNVDTGSLGGSLARRDLGDLAMKPSLGKDLAG
jgi:hypothetical protein